MLKKIDLMAEADDKGAGPVPTPQPPNPAPADDWKMEDLPPGVQEYIRVLRKEAGDTRTEAQKKLDQAKREREEEATKQLIAQQKWQELAEAHASKLKEVEPLAEQGKRIQEAFMSSLKKRMEVLPDYLKTLAEKISDPVILSNWLDENAERISPRQAPGQDGGPKGDGGKAPTLTADELAMARKMGLTAEEYVKYK